MASNRRPLIAGNWKMNGLSADSTALACAIAERYKAESAPKFDMLVCPPFTMIAKVADAVKDSGVFLGAQDCHAAEKGAHTADISTAMLDDLDCGYVIVGHSERRTDHGETNATVKAKAEAALKTGLIAIVCIGETEAERDAAKTLDVVKTQIAGSLPQGASAANTVIAYEPVWAIGTGRTPTNDEVQDVHAFMRAELTAAIGAAQADGMRLLYGGSMNPKNAEELLALADVDGGLIGGASLKVDDFWAVGQGCK